VILRRLDPGALVARRGRGFDRWDVNWWRPLTASGSSAPRRSTRKHVACYRQGPGVLLRRQCV